MDTKVISGGLIGVLGSGDDFGADPGRGRPDCSGAGGRVQPGPSHSGAGPAPEAPVDFYSARLDPAERLLFEHALRLEGLDQEIALLRLRIRRDLDDPKEMMRGIDLPACRAIITDKVRPSPDRPPDGPERLKLVGPEGRHHPGRTSRRLIPSRIAPDSMKRSPFSRALSSASSARMSSSICRVTSS